MNLRFLKSPVSNKKNSTQYVFPNSSHSCHYRRYRTYCTHDYDRFPPVESEWNKEQCRILLSKLLIVTFEERRSSTRGALKRAAFNVTEVKSSNLKKLTAKLQEFTYNHIWNSTLCNEPIMVVIKTQDFDCSLPLRTRVLPLAFGGCECNIADRTVRLGGCECNIDYRTVRLGGCECNIDYRTVRLGGCECNIADHTVWLGGCECDIADHTVRLGGCECNIADRTVRLGGCECNIADRTVWLGGCECNIDYRTVRLGGCECNIADRTVRLGGCECNIDYRTVRLGGCECNIDYRTVRLGGCECNIADHTVRLDGDRIRAATVIQSLSERDLDCGWRYATVARVRRRHALRSVMAAACELQITHATVHTARPKTNITPPALHSAIVSS
ncbi:hypothetical protein ANN_22738 [Periplaneta americana]|uniref:Uncharacterized protein n=1 Tax=Periplaneta americana TaxID=6978 RepID=A0ABQ8SL47_PERAM|nr:hypothetical protein ANN_22738 [Periplaneta americana]